jgi:hypothetical protein
MTILRKRLACWIPKATNTQSEYVILTAFPMQQGLYEHASVFRYTYIDSFVLVVKEVKLFTSAVV